MTLVIISSNRTLNRDVGQVTRILIEVNPEVKFGPNLDNIGANLRTDGPDLNHIDLNLVMDDLDFGHNDSDPWMDDSTNGVIMFWGLLADRRPTKSPTAYTGGIR